MIPDVRTMWMVVATTALLFGFLEVCAGYGRRRDIAMVMWGCANLAGGVGAGLLSTQGILPYAISEALANGFLVLVWSLIWAGVRVFASGPILWWANLIGPAAVVIACLYIPPFTTDMVMRIHLTSLGIVAYLILIAAEAVRAERRERLVMRRVLAVLSLVSVVPVTWRAVNAELHSGAFDLMKNTAATAMPLVLLFVAAIAINVCLLLIGRERLGNQLAQAAVHDGLTGALNRTGFLVQAQEAADSCHRNDGVCSMVLMDLDEFKAVNDRYGHGAGDLLLAEFATIARNKLRAGDVLGRIGGEEFCALLVGAGEGEAVDVSDRLRMAYAGAVFDYAGGVVTGTVSMGVAQVRSGEELAEAIRRADEAMYRAKKDGRDRVVGASD
jgi:diguanylate cyclase (GGDEF)-like protein